MIKALSLLLGLASLTARAQTPQPVYGFVKDRHELSWYAEQEVLWKKEVDKDKHNAEAWNYYYESVRAQQQLCDHDSKDCEALREKLNAITDELYATLPESFEANYLMYRNYRQLGNGEHIKYIQRAFEIDPGDTRVYDLFMIEYELSRNKSAFHDFSVRYFNSGDLPAGVYNWGYNLLSELDENAIIITGGDLDTYALWMMQEAQNFRKDVQVINGYLLQIKHYRDKLLAELGLEPFEAVLNHDASHEEYTNWHKKLYHHLFDNNKNRPVYIASTAVIDFDESFGEQLYLTGLAYKYSGEKIDNVSLIRRNYEKRYLLDYLSMTFAFHSYNSINHRLNETYLPAFIKLYRHYADCEEKEKMLQLREYLVNISRQANMYDEVMTLIETK